MAGKEVTTTQAMMNDAEVERMLHDELTPGKPGNESSASSTAAGADAGSNAPATPKLYKLPDGRQVDADTLEKEWSENFEPEYRRVTQENSDLKKNPPNKQSEPTPAEPSTKLDAHDQAILDELKRFGVVFKEDVKDLGGKASQTAIAQIKLQEMLSELETDFDGSKDEKTGAVKPKVKADEIIGFIRQNPNTSLSPLQIARVVHPDAFADYDVASRGSMQPAKPALPSTENAGSGSGNANPPTPKYDLTDGSAEKGLASILTAS